MMEKPNNFFNESPNTLRVPRSIPTTHMRQYPISPRNEKAPRSSIGEHSWRYKIRTASDRGENNAAIALPIPNSSGDQTKMARN